MEELQYAWDKHNNKEQEQEKEEQQQQQQQQWQFFCIWYTQIRTHQSHQDILQKGNVEYDSSMGGGIFVRRWSCDTKNHVFQPWMI